jgi:hypothetical protein
MEKERVNQFVFEEEKATGVDEEKPLPDAKGTKDEGNDSALDPRNNNNKKKWILATVVSLVLIAAIFVPVTIVKVGGDDDGSEDSSARYWDYSIVSEDKLIDITAAMSHTCAIKVINNEVFCWGSINAAPKGLAATKLATGSFFPVPSARLIPTFSVGEMVSYPNLQRILEQYLPWRLDLHLFAPSCRRTLLYVAGALREKNTETT